MLQLTDLVTQLGIDHDQEVKNWTSDLASSLNEGHSERSVM